MIHFSGHGLPAGLVLERPDGRQDRISVRDLERLLRPARRRLKLVTLSACESAAPTVQETLRWLKLPEPQRSEAEARAEPAPAIAAEPLPALARSLAESLGCAVLAMRYPVGDAFAIELAGRFYRALFEQRRNLPAALQLALPQALPAHPQPGMPPLSVAAPALFGALAASLTLPLPPGASPPFDLSQPGMAEFPPEPEHFVGRGGPLARGSMAMAPESGQRAVLFYGMAGVGKTACALELAYRYETGRFERLVWHKGPDEGHDIADALLRLAIDLERQLPGFTMAHVVDRADEFTAWLPRLRELLEQRSILIVLDNLESLLTAEGHWRDARWEALVSVLMDHGGLSRTVLTSRRRPFDLRYETRILIEAIHPLSLAEAALLARELPHLGALLQGKHPAGLEGGRELVTYALQVVQGHPKLLEFAEAQARDPQALAGHLAQAADSERREGQLQAFFREGESDLPAEVFLVALEDWTRRIAGRLPPGVRTLFYMLCALEEEDRVEFVLKRVWSNLWGRLQSLGEVPSLAHGLALLVESGLIEAQPEGDSVTRYGLHPAVAEAGWAEMGAALQAAVDRELAAMWQAIFQQGMEAEQQRRGSLIGRGQLAVGAGWRAVPYLLRRERWAEAGFLIEQIVVRDPSPAILAAVLPWLRRTVTATAGTPEGLGHLGVLARALELAGRWPEAETTMRETISLAAAQGDFRLASAATSDLINLLRDTGHLDKALAHCDEHAGVHPAGRVWPLDAARRRGAASASSGRPWALCGGAGGGARAATGAACPAGGECPGRDGARPGRAGSNSQRR